MKINFRYIRYGLFVISFVILIFAIKIFLQNFNMNKNIQELKETQIILSGDTVWLEKYYNPFLNSSYSKLLLLHTSGLPAKSEILIKIDKFEIINTLNNIDKQTESIVIGSIKDFWNNFYYSFKKNIFLDK